MGILEKEIGRLSKLKRNDEMNHSDERGLLDEIRL